MADRYWVGGTANWDGTAGTKWSATSGGAGGASVPTSADDVFFDAASGAGTVTIASGNLGAKSINCTGFTGFLTGGGALSVAGSITLSTGMFYSYFGSLTITGSGTITSAGKSFNAVTINGAGITVELGDAYQSSSAVFTLTQGTFNTNNFAVTWDRFVTAGSATRAINLGSSTVTIVGFSGAAISVTSTTGLTFNADTSQINITANSGNNASINVSDGLSITFNNVSFTSVSTNIRAITGNNTFNNLSFTGPSSTGVTQCTLRGSQTINGVLSTTGTAGNRRVWLQSVTYGLTRTLTVNGTPSITDMDFRDIIVVGTAAPISGTRIGDLRGNIGITFSAPKTVYRIGTGNWSDNQWSDTSGGSVSTNNFPLAQDTAVFDESTTAGTHTLNSLVPYCGTVDMSARTSSLTLSLGAAYTIYGNWINGTGITISGTQTLTFSGRNTQTITSASRSFSGDVTVDTYGGFVELADALNLGSRTLIITNGTFDTGGFNVTAGSLSSNNTNVRSILLRSSTLTLSGSSPITLASTNLTFDAGTSTIQCTSSSSMTFTGGGVTYHNVSFTNTAGGQPTINSTNTFNNLSVTAPSSTTIQSVIFGADQTISGTFTVNGGSPIRRLFVRSNTIGTTRTLTVGTLSATDCDFRDITITGAATGSSPTRAGDCGGNSGITFPAPKTVYWNLAGTQNWSATGWAASSGGSPDINNFPLAQDTAVFDDAGSADTVTFTPDWSVGTFDLSARTTAMTFNISAGPNIHGNILIGSGVTLSGTGNIRFNGRGTSTITSNGITFGGSMTVDCVTGTVQLADALSLTGSLTVTSGTFDAVSYNVTALSTNISGSTARTVRMGSGTWTLTGTSTIWSASTTTGLSFNPGTAEIVLSNTSTTARTFAGGELYYHKLTIGGATGTSTLTITGSNTFGELASTKTVAHTIALGSTVQKFGKWSVTGTAGNVVTLTGTGTSHILAGACTSGIDYLAMGSIGFAATSPGEFYAGANSTGTAGAPVYRTAKPADSTRYWVGGTGNWSDTNRWSDASGGAGGFSVPRSHDDVVFDSSSNATAYTATVNTVTGGARCKSLTIAGPASGNVTLAGSVALFIHDNVTLPATGLTRTYTGTITLTGSSTGRTFTTNGVTLNSTIIIDGIGSEWLLGSALFNGTSQIIIVTNGTFDLNNYNLTADSLSSGGTSLRTIKLGSGTIFLFGSTGVFFGLTPTAANTLTLDAGTSEIRCSSSSAGFRGNGKTFYNVSLTSTARSSSVIGGTAGGAGTTFNNLTITGLLSGPSICTVLIDLPGIITVNGTFTVSAGASAAHRTFVVSSSIGTTATITCGAFSGTDVDFRDIAVTGAAAPISGTRLGDCKGNSGITFPASTTKYWNFAAGGNWTSTGWTTTSGGTPTVNDFPLPQDTCVFEATGLNSGATITMNGAFNVGTIDMSARTTNTMTFSVSSGFTIYGNWINGTGTTVASSGIPTFAGRTSQTITSAGKTFNPSVTVDSPGGSVTLLDAFACASLSVTSGTFNADVYNVTIVSLISTNSNLRTIAIGSGTWSVTSSGTIWNLANQTNATITGTGTISFTSGGAKTFNCALDLSGITLNQGGAGTLTISGSNSFKDITATYTATGATTINLGTNTQRLAQFRGKGESGRQLTITGTSSSTPCNLIYTGTGYATNNSVDFLTLTGVRAYVLQNTWFAGNSSINDGTLGWAFAGTPAVVQDGNFLMLT